MHKRDFGTWVRCEICGERRIYNSIGERLVAECQHETQEPFETPVTVEPPRDAHLQELARLVDQRIAAALEGLGDQLAGWGSLGASFRNFSRELREGRS